MHNYFQSLSSIQCDDYSFLHEAIVSLDENEMLAIVLRFWGNYTIEEISNELGVCWDKADQTINLALEKLKNELLSSPALAERFSEVA